MEHIIFDILLDHETLRHFKGAIELDDKIEYGLYEVTYHKVVRHLENVLNLAVIPIWRLDYNTATFRDLIAQICLTNSRLFSIEEVEAAHKYYTEQNNPTNYKRLYELTKYMEWIEPIPEIKLMKRKP